MLYLASEIVAYLAVAAVLGGLVGWGLRGLRLPPAPAVPERVWREKLGRVREERDEARHRATELADRIHLLEAAAETGDPRSEGVDRSPTPSDPPGDVPLSLAAAGVAAAAIPEQPPVGREGDGLRSGEPGSPAPDRSSTGLDEPAPDQAEAAEPRPASAGEASAPAVSPSEVPDAAPEPPPRQRPGGLGSRERDLGALEGVEWALGERLARLGVTTTRELLERLRTEPGRKAMSEELDVPKRWVRRWATLADLMRIPEIEPATACLLEASGIDSIQELARQLPDELVEQMAMVNTTQGLAPSVPERTVVSRWVERARALHRILEP